MLEFLLLLFNGLLNTQRCWYNEKKEFIEEPQTKCEIKHISY